MERLTPYRLRQMRERMHQESEVVDGACRRLLDLAGSIPAPGVDELRAMEKGEVPLSLEAAWISILDEQMFWLSDAATALEVEAGLTRGFIKRFWYPGKRPEAKLIAHLRGGLRGRTLPEDFMPEPRNVPLRVLLRGEEYGSMAGVGLVTDLLVRGYRWGG